MWKHILKLNTPCSSKMFLCQIIYTALILEISVILTPTGLAKVRQEFGIFVVCYSTTEHGGFLESCFSSPHRNRTEPGFDNCQHVI